MRTNVTIIEVVTRTSQQMNFDKTMLLTLSNEDAHGWLSHQLTLSLRQAKEFHEFIDANCKGK